MNFAKLAPVYLRVMRYTQGFETINDYSILPRPYSSVAYIVSGFADFVQDGVSSRVNQGDLILTPRGSTYVSYWHASPETVFISCHFDFSVTGICDNGCCAVQKVSGLSYLGGDFIALAEKFGKLGENEVLGRLFMLERFYKVFGALFPRIIRRDTAELDTLIMRATDYIEAHFTEKTEVVQLAKLCNLSESHFFARFRKSVGTSPIEYKNRIAISRAEQLLADEPSLSVEEVSERMGFESSAYFRRVFRRVTGMSPRDYRKSERERM